MQRAKTLAAECDELLLESKYLRGQYPKPEETSMLMDIFYLGEDIQLSILQTFAHQATSKIDELPGSFSNECVKAAKHAIHIHMSSVHLMGFGPYAKSSYLNW